MDLNGMDQTGNINDDEPSLPLNSYTEGVYGDPQVSPRVGNQYQVEIPALISESEYSSYTTDPLKDENKCGPHDFVRPYEHNVESSDAGSRIVMMEADELEEKTDETNGFLVPGSCGDSWSYIEKSSFLLGLYIFRKNFVLIKRFVETRKMGEILYLYHTKFYQTAEYRKWSACRKGKTRNCALGQTLFSGSRQDELLSRLACGISKELKTPLMQISKNFSDGRISLEEYIFSLKRMVGMNNLVNAVGIGGGKKYLPVGAIEPSKANQAILNQPVVPIGKGYSSLGPNEIVNILTGDYRLSKSRSADLFWEAAWPILVSKGWDVTESSSYSYAASSKKSHVFFAPGVPKLPSQRGLVKGVEYFDSIVDVLDLIASDPGILDLGKEKGEAIVEDGNDDLAKSYDDHIAPDGKRLKRLSMCSKEGSSSQGVVNLSRPSSDMPEISEHVQRFEERTQENEPNERPLFDLNLPAEPVDLDCDDSEPEVAEPQPQDDAPDESMAEPEPQPQDAPDESMAEPLPQDDLDELGEPMAGAEEGQMRLNSRRQSSRNRPPTARALEAIACGFLSASSRRRRGRGRGSSR